MSISHLKYMTIRNTGICVGIIGIVSVQYSLFACWGVRPLSMGGAFVAVADDVHSIYWNPAGLGSIESPELTYTRLISLRDKASYDDFLAFAIPLRYGALGMGYTYDGERKKMFGNEENYFDIETDSYYLNIGYGFSIKNVAMGLNVKLIAVDFNSSGVSGGIPVDYSDSDFIIPLDFGLLWNLSPHLSFGVLCQNFNEPSLKLSDSKLEYLFNLRPGIALRPNNDLTFSLEIYDLLNNTKGASGGDISMGMEKKINEHITVRAGGYHINNSDKSMITAGVGVSFHNWKFDYGIMSGSDIEDALHLLSFGYRF